MKRKPCEIIVPGSGAFDKYPDKEGYYLFHSSRFGACCHGQVKSLLGFDFPDISQELKDHFEEGHAGEEVVKKDLRVTLGSLKYSSYVVAEQLSAHVEGVAERSKWMISCHPDGVLDHSEHPFSLINWLAAGSTPLHTGVCAKMEGDRRIYVFEHKHLGSYSYEKFLEKGISGFDTYLWQTSIQSHAVRNHFKLDYCPPIVFSVSRRNFNGTSPNKKFQLLLEPFYSYGDLKARAAGIIQCHKAGHVPECDIPFYCEYLRKGSKERVES